jgi:two-component system sensor histidine kinase SenX3
MDRRRLFLALLWPTALVVLVGVLAFFQYRWLGQVSEADRDRQRATLNQRAREFAGDFDREIGRLFSAMQLGGSVIANTGESMAAQYDRWKETAAFPQLVRGIYLTSEVSAQDDPTAEEAPVALQKFDPAARTFSTVEWPASLAPVRERLRAVQHRFTAPATPFSSSGNTTFRFVSLGQSPIMAAVPALVIPMQSVQPISAGPAEAREFIRLDMDPRYVIVELDKQAITGTVLPALVEKHLSIDDYHVQVTELHANAAPTPIYKKGLAATANLNPATADAATTFFNVRMDNVALSGMRGLPTGGSLTLPIPASAEASSQMSIVVQSTGDRRTVTELKAAAERQGVEAALQNRVAGRGSIGATGIALGPGAWQLVLQHPAGSLEAAVTKARRRNLAISFGVLAVLSVSVFLISINAQRSQRLAAQQMDFVATVSHELRTPIAVIRSAAQNLSAGVIHDAARAKKYGELIDTEGRRLTDMVEEVLEFAGISGGKRQFSIAPTDIGRLTTDVMESCDALIREAGFLVEVAVAPNLPLVNLDESAYRRALTNLVTNALKYGTDGKWMAVTVCQAPNHQVAVTVADRGRGIDPKDLPHVFDAFYRGGYAKERQIHGNGLGLSLVQRIVDAHGGSVSVQTSSAGSTFTMKFSEGQ